MVLFATGVTLISQESEVLRQIGEIFRSAQLEGFLHARNLDTDAALSYGGQTICASASVGKVPILVALMQAVAAGELSLDRRIFVPAEPRTGGPTGLSVLSDPVELSLRAVAELMIAVSDNHATDLVLDRVSPERVTEAMRWLGLGATTLTGTIRDLYERSDERMAGATDRATILARLRTDPDLKPETAAWRTTPEETTKLWQLIWTDDPAPKPLCEEMRAMLRRCATHNGLVAGFPAEVQERIAHKTGTLTGIRNEAGVVEYANGSRCAVAVFTVADVETWKPQDLAASAAIGQAAALAASYVTR